MRSIDVYIKKKNIDSTKDKKVGKNLSEKNGIETKEIRAKHNICKLQAQDIDINW